MDVTLSAPMVKAEVVMSIQEHAHITAWVQAYRGVDTDPDSGAPLPRAALELLEKVSRGGVFPGWVNPTEVDSSSIHVD